MDSPGSSCMLITEIPYRAKPSGESCSRTCSRSTDLSTSTLSSPTMGAMPCCRHTSPLRNPFSSIAKRVKSTGVFHLLLAFLDGRRKAQAMPQVFIVLPEHTKAPWFRFLAFYKRVASFRRGSDLFRLRSVLGVWTKCRPTSETWCFVRSSCVTTNVPHAFLFDRTSPVMPSLSPCRTRHACPLLTMSSVPRASRSWGYFNRVRGRLGSWGASILSRPVAVPRGGKSTSP